MDTRELLTRGVEKVIEHEHLKARLEHGDKLRVKLGIDPTARDLHLGHTVALRKLRQFQDAGHQAILIIGDFTALVGDPSGRNDLRPMLTSEQIKENEAAYFELAGKVLDIEKAEVRHNSEWYQWYDMKFLMDLERRATVSQILERDDFQKRLKSGGDVNMLETIYPFLQGYDSVATKADVELGGTDQTFNMLMGRKIQRSFGMAEQDVMTVPLIEGLDGSKKMSKSSDNYIALNDVPSDMFGKVMSIPDALMEKYYTLLTGLDFDRGLQPKAAKELLGHELVRLYHGQSAADEAQEEFKNVFTKGETPELAPEVLASGKSLVETITQAIGNSKTEAKRLLNDGAVKINGQKTTGWDVVVHRGDVIQVGPHRFFKVI